MTTQIQSTMRRINIKNTLLIIALALMTIHLLIYLAYGAALIPFPFDYDQAEGYELNNAILLAQGGCPYCNNDEFPFYASGYAPFYHILMVPFVWLFGAGFWYGRLIIFISTFITAGAIGYAIHRDSKQRWIAILAGLAFLASNYIYHIGPLLRQHLLMVMLETLAVVIIAPAFDVKQPFKRRRLFIAFLLLLLAGYTKQLAYSTCIAVTMWVFLKNPRTALKYAAGVIVVAGIIFGLWMLATEGHWWTNIISSNQNPYYPQQFFDLITQFIRLHWTLILLAIPVILHDIYFSRISVYSIWFVVSFISTVGAGKWGAGDSYFDTTLAATCLLAGIFLSRTLARTWHFPPNYISNFFNKTIRVSSQTIYTLASIVASGLFVVYGLTVVKLPTSGAFFGGIANALNIEANSRYPLYDPAGWVIGYALTGHHPSQADYENGWYIVEQVRQTEGLVMSEDAGFSIQADREVITNGVQLRNLWLNGLYDPTELVTMLENQEFGLIILRGQFFPQPVLESIGANYDLDETIAMNGFEYLLFRPEPQQDTD